MVANLELYRVFYWVAKEQNLTRAAQRLFITQPSVSHAIKQLEHELAVNLFHREPRGVRLTEEGRVLFIQVEQAFAALESAEKQMAELNNLMQGELRLGSSDSLCKYYLLPALGPFCSDNPKIRLDLQHGITPEIVRFIKEGKIDLGIVRLPLVDEALTITETITVQDCFVAGHRYAHLTSGALSLHELVQHPLILFSKTSSSRRFIQQFALEQNIYLEPEIELASVDLLIEFAKAGLGISFVTKQFIQRQLDAGSLAEIHLDIPIPPRKIGIAYLKNRRLSSATKVFLQHYLHVEI